MHPGYNVPALQCILVTIRRRLCVRGSGQEVGRGWHNVPSPPLGYQPEGTRMHAPSDDDSTKRTAAQNATAAAALRQGLPHLPMRHVQTMSCIPVPYVGALKTTIHEYMTEPFVKTIIDYPTRLFTPTPLLFTPPPSRPPRPRPQSLHPARPLDKTYLMDHQTLARKRDVAPPVLDGGVALDATALARAVTLHAAAAGEDAAEGSRDLAEDAVAIDLRAGASKQLGECMSSSLGECMHHPVYRRACMRRRRTQVPV